VIVLLELNRWIREPQAARHAEVDDERAGFFQMKDEVFRAAVNVDDSVAADLIERFGNGIAELVVSNGDLTDWHADEMGRDAAPGGLDFGKLGHAQGRM